MELSQVKTICVLGAGTMGSGIAQVAAQSGYDVVLRDISEDLLVRGMGNIKGSLERLAKAGQLEAARVQAILARIRLTTDMAAAAREAQVVIEAVPESLELKQSIFKELDQICPPEVILASNTSALSITSVASATRHRGRVVGMHWFNPAPIMRLVEIVRGLETSDETVRTIQDLATRMGKETVIAQDSQGFIVTRALTPFLLECYKMLEEGIATKEDLDLAIKLGLNHPMGPFQLSDFIGLDVELSICEDMRRIYGERFLSRFFACENSLMVAQASGLCERARRPFHPLGALFSPAVVPQRGMKSFAQNDIRPLCHPERREGSQNTSERMGTCATKH